MRQKVVWLFNHYAQEPRGAGGTRHFSLAKNMLKMGWNVQIVAASVDHFSGTQRLDEPVAFRRDKIEDVSFIWLKTPEYQGSGLLRVVNMFAYSFRAYFGSWKVDTQKPDVIVGSSVHPFAAVSAALLAKKYDVPFIFEVRDLWPETLVAMGLWPKESWKTKFFIGLEKWLYRRADKIITLLPYAHEYISSLGIDEKKIVWISNGVELGDEPKSINDNNEEKFTLMYLGSHGQANGLDTLIDAMKMIQDTHLGNDIQLVMIGEGTDKKELIGQAKRYGLKNIAFRDAVTKNEVPQLASQADAFVLCVRDLPALYRYGISMNKIFDYMAAGRPVVIASNARNNPIGDAQCGLSVAAEDSEALAKAIVEISHLSLDERKKMGEQGRDFVKENFDYKILASSFVSVLDEVCEESRCER